MGILQCLNNLNYYGIVASKHLDKFPHSPEVDTHSAGDIILSDNMPCWELQEQCRIVVILFFLYFS